MTYKLGKRCPICGKYLQDSNKSGFCNIHRPRTGENNPFYGKHHTKETLEKIKKRTSIASVEKWKDDEYRNHVISNMIGVKRSESFKETQRNNALQQFKNEEQRILRSENMKQSWLKGKITKTKHTSYNKSKQEKRLISLLSQYFNTLSEETIEYKEGNKRKWLFPDIVIDKIIIEYNGSYWHADPEIYKSSEIIHHGKTAQDIWDEDLRKRRIYENLGYNVIYVWSKDFLINPEKYVENLSEIIYNLINK